MNNGILRTSDMKCRRYKYRVQEANIEKCNPYVSAHSYISFAWIIKVMRKAIIAINELYVKSFQVYLQLPL